MYQLTFLPLAAFFGSALAKKCMNFTIPVDISARQGIFNTPIPTGNQDVTTFTQAFNSIMNGTNYTEEALLGYQTITGAYDISAKFCTPDVVGSNPTVQVLTHGIGFDKTYWDLPYNNFNYSYIDLAVDKFNFCTLSIDRFGIGNSSHADPLNVVQAPAEISALYQINTMLRKGKLPNVPHAFTKIVNVGHSYGSQQSYQLALAYPNATDGLILTGFSFNGSFTPPTLSSFNSKIARLNQPLRFGSTTAAEVQSALSKCSSLTNLPQIASELSITSEELNQILTTTEIFDLGAGLSGPPLPPQNLPNGYITWADTWANQYAFLYPTGFDPNILFYAEAHKQPYTLGEIFTLGGAPAVTTFSGPVQILTGREDAIYCGGDCLATGVPDIPSIPAAAAMYFPSAKPFEAYIQPNTGHGITLHYNSTEAYAVAQEFLVGNGLAPS